LGESSKSYSLTSTSKAGVDQTDLLSRSQARIAKDFFTEFHDMDVAVEKNYIFIRHALLNLQNSNKKFIFSTGGFEHYSYMTETSRYSNKFSEFDSYKSKYNLWDHITDYRSHRPYFHITEPNVTQAIADYYKDFIV
jgi:protoheme ferro-lyase